VASITMARAPDDNAGGASGANGRRAHQKLRTRQALIDAGLSLLRAGQSPTVSEVARAAGVSPATAYRYFSSNAELWRAVATELGAPDIDAVLDGLTDVDARVDAMVRALALRRYDDEAFWRAAAAVMFKRSVDDARGEDRIPTPTGQRLRWIEAALAPLRPELSAVDYRQLRNAFAMILGAESMVALRDVVGLSPAAAKEATRFAARALLQAGKARARPAARAAKSRSKRG